MRKNKLLIRISTGIIGAILATQLIASACGTSLSKIIPADIARQYTSGAPQGIKNGILDLLKSKYNAQTPSKEAAPKGDTTASEKPPVTATTDFAAFQSKVIELVNKERAKAGLKPLAADAKLNNMATVKSQDMAKNNYFDHNSPKYGSPFDMMKTFGISYRTAGENIAMGQTTPEQVMNGWMNSPGHRANILKSSFTKIGVGVAKNSSGRIYWTQEFIG